MVMIYSYNCLRCGKPTRHQLFVLTCQSCGIPICKECSKGSLCLQCYNSLPEELQKKYCHQLDKPKKKLKIILLVLSPLFIIFPPLICLGLTAYYKDHGKNKTTPRSEVLKAQNIVTEARQNNQGISQPQTSQNYPQQQQQNQQQQNQQQTYQKDPDSKYGGTFWE